LLNLHAKRFAYRFQRRKKPITQKNEILPEIRYYSSTLGDILTFYCYFSLTLHAKRCAYRFQRRNHPITEKNAILNEIRRYSSTIRDVLTF
jgi:hypothetical protein